MATIGNGNLTLLDVAKQTDPDGNTSDIVEMLAQTNEMVQDMVWKEGNLPTGNRNTVRTSLPQVYFRSMNKGTPNSKGTTAQVDEAGAQITGKSVCDKTVADVSGNVGKFRLNQSKGYIEAMSQEMGGTALYGNAIAAPNEFHGLLTRMGAISGAVNAQNILDAGGTGSDNTSILIVTWADDLISGIYNKGTKAGLQHIDMGTEFERDADGNEFLAYRDYYEWNCGLNVTDWRYMASIRNIDVSNLVSGSNSADLINAMIKLKHRIPNLKAGKPIIYCNRTVRQMLDIQALAKSNAALSIREAAGQFETNFFGIPIHTMDQILDTEARVV